MIVRYSMDVNSVSAQTTLLDPLERDRSKLNKTVS